MLIKMLSRYGLDTDRQRRRNVAIALRVFIFVQLFGLLSVWQFQLARGQMRELQHLIDTGTPA